MPWIMNEDAALHMFSRAMPYTSRMDVLTALRDKIARNDCLPDGKLGTYPSLKEELSVPEKKLAAALQVLRAEGLVEIRKGRGGIYLADRPAIRFCSLGGHYVALEGFAKSKVSAKNPEGRQAYCQECARLNSQLRWHNMSLAEYRQRLLDQANACASCGDAFLEDARAIHIDHDHSCCPGGRSCGKCTRALLCRRCNLTVGFSGDDVARLIAAANYLRQYKEVV